MKNKSGKLSSLKNQLESIMKPVEKVFLSDLIPGIQSNPQQECAIIVKENGVDKIVNVCSKQYNLLPNREIFEPLLETFADQNVKLVIDSKMDARFSVDLVFQDYTADIMGKDKIHAKLKVHNSYDGRAKYQFHMGFFRIICKNGMVIPLEGYENKNISKKMRHTPGLGETFDRDKITEMVQSFGENMLMFEKPFEDLASKKISEAALPELLKEVTSSTKFPVRQLDEVIDRLAIEMEILNEKNINHWLVYNAFNYQLNHSESITLDPAKKEDLDQDVFRLLLKY